ncbi:hypothetical protein C2I33_13440 [Ralstonia solanacearum]|uniref:hypothetical protein n=2 Tax=Ralstonia solanacearum TaxID=305 RepID=UPI0001816CBC|nr:hypothetical protein [Ralstonia solanacearum]MDC6180016.1 hypothetical protein [Ralstonia solanacearum]MDC6212604.1 hypothetical protein [Ralstonia solanacearum]MDC6241467.1 hypothetical protein [Ralstonia solanacearum]MDD7800854.1 hypothetical protein [Ralstonia solanacearum]TYZ54446.1 hypothetical protein C2I33_13440 [Ralstonia solanacearum]
MFWMLYLLPAAFAASKVAPKHGFLAGIATLVAVLVGQSMLLRWWVGWMERRRAAQPPSADPVAQGPGSATTAPRRDTPVRTGERACFVQLNLCDGQSGPDFARQLYDVLLKVIDAHVDVETATGDADAAMVSATESAAGQDAETTHPGDPLVVFRSHDRAWLGFRLGNDSFRFRHRAIAEVEFHTILPARGGGGYAFALTFDVPRKSAAPGDRSPYLNRSDSPGYLFGYADARSVALARAFAEIARMACAKFAVSEYMDV